MVAKNMDTVPNRLQQAEGFDEKFERIVGKFKDRIGYVGAVDIPKDSERSQIKEIARGLSAEHGSAIHAIKIFDPQTKEARNIMWSDDALPHADIKRAAAKEGLQTSHERSFVSDSRSEERFSEGRWAAILDWLQRPPGWLSLRDELKKDLGALSRFLGL